MTGIRGAFLRRGEVLFGHCWESKAYTVHTDVLNKAMPHVVFESSVAVMTCALVTAMLDVCGLV